MTATGFLVLGSIFVLVFISARNSAHGSSDATGEQGTSCDSVFLSGSSSLSDGPTIEGISTDNTESLDPY